MYKKNESTLGTPERCLRFLWLENLPNYPKSNSLITNYCFFFLLKNSLQYIFLTFKCDSPYQLFPQNCTNNSELWKRYLHFFMDLRVSHFANPYNIDQSDAYLGIMAFILYFNIKIKKKSGFSFFLLLNKHTVKKI